MSSVTRDAEDRLIADDRKAFERLANKAVACGLSRSRRGTYVNPSIARDWKWFDLGLIHARAVAHQLEAAEAGFPARILALLHELADRDGTPTQGPAEDGNGEPLQDDADAALAWISACHQTQADAAAMVAAAWEQVEHRDRICSELRAMLEAADAGRLLDGRKHDGVPS